MAWLKNHPVLVGGGVVAAAVVLYLAFAIFGIHTLFIDDEVNESGPVFASGAGASALPSDAVPADMAEEMTEVMADEPVMVEADDDMPDMVAEVVTLASGSFIDRSHPASGMALVLNDGTEQRFLRFEDFETDNGPDLNVYLSTAPPDAPAGDFDDDFVDLGDLKGNIGPQNYEIPTNVDLSRHSTVVIWCVRFGVAFGAAELG